MNGKQAKKLRRIAMGMATTFDEAGQKIKQNGYVQQHHKLASNKAVSASSAVWKLNEDDPSSRVPEKREFDVIPSRESIEAQREAFFAQRFTNINDPDSLRAMYRKIKKGVTEGKIKL